VSFVYSVDVRIAAPVQDTELEDRVVRAIHEIFPDAEIQRGAEQVTATTHSVETFAAKLRQQRILDTARRTLHGGREGEVIAFDLKKQAAFEGVVNFAVGNEAELGDLAVEMRVCQPPAPEFVAALAPETDEEGRPLEDPFA
jgi:hypothetical protein